MKKLVIAFVASALLAVPALAADKIAVVNTAAAIFSSNAAKAKAEAAQKSADYIALKAKLDSATADLQALAKEWEAKSVTWSAEQKAEHQKKMEYVQADRELAGRKIQAENKALEQEIVTELRPIAQKALQEIVDKESITLLLPAEAVVWAKPELDITGKLADAINKTAK